MEKENLTLEGYIYMCVCPREVPNTIFCLFHMYECM